MTDAVRYPLVLGLISLSSAAALALSYSLTREEINRQAALEKAQGLATVFGVELKEGHKPPWQELGAPAGQGTEAAHTVYAATDPKTGRALYAADGSARGYASRIDVVVSVDQGVRDNPKAARIKAVKVVAQNDTPGLGNKCQAPEFQAQFADLLVGRLEIRKGAPYRVPGKPGSEEQEISAITGATITSNAVLSAVRQAIERIRERAAQAPKPDAAKGTP